MIILLKKYILDGIWFYICMSKGEELCVNYINNRKNENGINEKGRPMKSAKIDDSPFVKRKLMTGEFHYKTIYYESFNVKILI